MQHCSRRILAALAVLCANSAYAASPGQDLVGCWRATAIAQVFSDGARSEDRSGRCTLRYTQDLLESRCISTSGVVATTYSYRIVRPNVYEATMMTSTFGTSLIGSKRDYDFQVDAQRLLLTTRPPSRAPAPTVAVVRVETEANRIPCE